MLSLNKVLIPIAVAASLPLAACGSSSNSSGSSSPGASTAASSAPAAATQPPATASSDASVEIGTASGSAGTYLTGGSGRALYLWVADSGGTSACSGACAQVWPPVTATAVPKVSGGASAADITLISRTDGTKQVAYKGHPLYYYAADSGSGTTHGQGSGSFGAKWWLVSPSGAQITGSSSGASSSTSTSTSSTSSSGGGGWG